MGAVARGARGGDEVGPLAAARSRPGVRECGPTRPRRGGGNQMSSGGAEVERSEFLLPARDGTLGRLMKTRTRQRRLRKPTREMHERIVRLGPPPVGAFPQ